MRCGLGPDQPFGCIPYTELNALRDVRLIVEDGQEGELVSADGHVDGIVATELTIDVGQDNVAWVTAGHVEVVDLGNDGHDVLICPFIDFEDRRLDIHVQTECEPFSVAETWNSTVGISTGEAAFEHQVEFILTDVHELRGTHGDRDFFIPANDTG